MPNVRSATANDSEGLTALSLESKGVWGYPKEYFEVWKNELTVTPSYIERNIVFLAEIGVEIVGYYSIVADPTYHPKSANLEHLFISPRHFGKKFGSMLYEHAKLMAVRSGIESLLVFVDPFAKGFYEKVGANYLRDVQSSIPGRQIPLFEVELRGS